MTSRVFCQGEVKYKDWDISYPDYKPVNIQSTNEEEAKAFNKTRFNSFKFGNCQLSCVARPVGVDEYTSSYALSQSGLPLVRMHHGLIPGYERISGYFSGVIFL